MPYVNCRTCGEPFEVSLSYIENMIDDEVFCSANCRAEFQSNANQQTNSLGDSQSAADKVVPEKGLTPKPNFCYLISKPCVLPNKCYLKGCPLDR